MFTHLLDDIGIPKDFRHMDGNGVHTYKWISKNGVSMYVKYHWISNQGVESLITDEQVKNITNPGHATLDLYESILHGNYPSWTMKVQVMDPTNIGGLNFDPLDVTKTWPEDQFPSREVGVMTLNQNIDNFFNENEQLAFSPSHIVPGIYYSDDKLLQARIFSYPDTQRYRLGGNYLMLPVNAPRCPFHNNHFDGAMNFMHRSSQVNYFPSRVEKTTNADSFPTRSDNLSGIPVRQVIPLQNDFHQVTLLYQSFDAARKQRFIARVISSLQPPVAVDTRNIVIAYWTQVDNITLGPALRAAFNPNQTKHGMYY
jgi:catalase